MSNRRGGSGRLADLESLRRIERLAVGWTAAGAVAYVIAGSGPRLAGALALTGASAASIVAFRGLQRIVSAVGPPGAGPDAPPSAGEVPADEPPGFSGGRSTSGVGASGPPREGGTRDGEIGWRPGLGALVRLVLLLGIAGAGAFLLRAEHFPAVVLGFSTLPAALMTEGLLQVVRALRGRGRDHDDVS